jgi:hypothetical protein
MEVEENLVFGLFSFTVILGNAYRVLRTKKKEIHRQKERQVASGNVYQQSRKDINEEGMTNVYSLP